MARVVTPATQALADLLGAEMARPVAPAATMLARSLAARAGGGAAAVLFYGSALRDDALDGVLDFYVLLERAGDWPGSRLGALANRMLPPNVGYLEDTIDGRRLRAKYAVLTLDQFRGGMAARSFDTTLWARFSQPCACIHARSESDRAAVVDAVCRAAATAAWWAAALGPESGDASAYWSALYARTYELELRVERGARSDAMVAVAAPRYARLLRAAWCAAGVEFEATDDGRLRPLLARVDRDAASRRWRWRMRLGRPLNVMRLLKAAFTFDGAVDYVAWKVERHSGVRLEVAPWQRRFPLLAAPGMYLRLRRLGVLR